MLFSDRIPSRLSEYPTVAAFMSVLDELQNYKSEIISDSLRVNNPAVSMDKKWLLKKLSDYNIEFPYDYPIQVIQQVLLNADTLLGLRGSKIGLELLCSVLTLGEATVNDKYFYQDAKILTLNSKSTGFIVDSTDDPKYYLVNNNSYINPSASLSIAVKSKFFSGGYSDVERTIKDYVQESVKKFIGFSNYSLSFNFQGRSDWYFHKLLNKYFV